MTSVIDRLREKNIAPDRINRIVSGLRSKAREKGMADTEFNRRMGIASFDTSPLQESLVAAAKETFGETGEKYTREFFTLDDFISAGWEHSVTGLLESAPSEHAKGAAQMQKTVSQSAAEALGTISGDIPAGIVGFFAGGGTALGLGQAGPQVATPEEIVTVPAGAMAGSFAVPAVMRSVLLDAYENGEIDSPQRFWDVFSGAGIEGLKAYLTGASAGVAGKGAAMATTGIKSKLLRSTAVTEAEIAAFTTVGAGLEGHMPTWNDFAAAHVAIFGMKTGIGATKKTAQAATRKIGNVYEKTGVKPDELMKASERDPVLREDLASSNKEIPRAIETPEQRAEALDPTWDPASPKTREWQAKNSDRVHSTPEEAFGELSLTRMMEVDIKPEEMTYIYTRLLKEHGQDQMSASTRNALRQFVDNKVGDISKFEDAFFELKEDLVVYRGTDNRGLASTNSTSLLPDAAFTRADKNYGDMVRITLPAGTKVALPSRASAEKSLQREFEVYVHPNEKIVSLRAEKADGEGTNVRNVVDATVERKAVTRSEASERIGQKISVGEKEAKRGYGFHEIYRDVVDDLHQLNRVVKALAGGKELPAHENPYTLARLFRGVSGVADSFLDMGALDFAHKGRMSRSLRDIVKPIGDRGDLQAFREYAVSRRIVELDKRGIEHGFDAKDAARVVREGKRFEAEFKELRDYQSHLLKYLKDSGVVSEKAMKLMEDANQDYVPFYRVMGEGKSGGVGLRSASPIKKIKGSTKDVVDPIESIMRNTYVLTTIAERNRVMSALVKLQEANPSLEVMRVKAGQKTAEATIIKDLMEPYRKGDATFAETMESLAAFRKDVFIKGKEVVHFKNGKATIFEVNVELAEALSAIDRTALDPIVRVLSTPASLLRTGAILTPDFMARNAARDSLSAMMFSKEGFVPVIDTARGISMILGRSQAYKDWAASGGMFAHMQAVDRAYFQKGMKDMLLSIPLRNTLKNPIEILRALSGLVEQGTRVAVFERHMRKALKKGKSREEALAEAGFESRDVTLDFQKFGAKTRALNSLSAFFNAWVQGQDKLARSFKDNPKAMTAKVIGGIAIPSALLHMVNRDKEWYQELPAWQRDLYWHFSTGDGTEDFTIWRIPKPFELGLIFGTGTERMLEYTIEGNPKAGKDFMKSLSKSLTPNLMPTFMAVPVEVWANKSIFFDRPIVPRDRENMLPEYQYSPYTTETAKELGAAIGYVPGMRFSKMSSPAVVEHVIRGWTGGLGYYAIKTMDGLLEVAGITDPVVAPEKTLADVPLVKAFTTRHPTMGTESVEQFFDLYEKTSKYTNTYKKLMKEGRTQEALAIFEEQQDAGLVIKLDKQKQTISEMSRLIRQIHRLPRMEGMSDEELATFKRQTIDTLYIRINGIAKRGVEMMKQFQSSIDAK